jgi:misacylated tRNA(Ala) deacylase
MKSYDPRMHTAEHILNGTMVKMFGKGRSFSAHIEKKKSKCDYKNFNSNLSADEIAEVENRVNQVIESQLDVTETFLDFDEASKNFDLSRLPETGKDKVRIINVGDYDACPCIGNHVANTREIGSFKIISTDYKDDILRIRFKLSAVDNEKN